MRDTEYNHYCFLKAAMQVSDRSTEYDLDNDAEIENDVAVAGLIDVFPIDSGEPDYYTSGYHNPDDLVAAMKDSMDYLIELSTKDIEESPEGDFSLGRRSWSAILKSAEWLKNNSSSKVRTMHTALDNLAHADRRLKGREAEFLNEIARIWEIDTKRYKIEPSSASPGRTATSAQEDICPKCGSQMEKFMVAGGVMMTFGGPNSGVPQQFDPEDGYECPKCGYETIDYDTVTL